MDAGLRRIGVVIIGRNVAADLDASIRSVAAEVAGIVYVDSASRDESVGIARSAGADVVELGGAAPVTAALARHAGFTRLAEVAPQIEFVQFLDGDCTLDSTWLARGIEALDADPTLGAVWGWRRERHPEASGFNRVCDIEWRTPGPGETAHFGGDVLIRVAAYRAAGGYDPTIVASEDHELSIRVGQAGWRISRIDADMTRHDARMTRLGQWWRRSVRLGVGQAQVWQRHRGTRQRTAIVRAIAWGAVVPLCAIGAAWATGGWSLLALLLYPLRIARIAARFMRDGGTRRDALLWGVHCVAISFPSLCGIGVYILRLGRGQQQQIIEYQSSAGPP